MTLIDLGEVGFTPSDDPPPRPVPRWLRTLGVPARRKAAAVTALTLLAGAVGGTAPDPGPPPSYRTVPLINMSVNSFWSVDGVIVELAQDSRTMSATDLSRGEKLWSVTWGEPVLQMNSFDRDTIVVQSGPPQAIDPSPVIEQEEYVHQQAQGTVATIDLRTGRQRWLARGALISPYESEDLVVMRAGATAADWRIAGLDAADGHEIWSRPAPAGTRWTFTYVPDTFVAVSGGLILMDSHDGSVMSVGADGRSTPRGRVRPGGYLEWAWSDYLGITYRIGDVGPTDGPPATRFELHDLRRLTDKPLWSVTVDPLNGSTPWPCRTPDRVCMSDGNVRQELRIQDGSNAGVHEDVAAYDPSTSNVLGLWNIVGSWQSGTSLATVTPAVSRTGVGWLGLIRVRDGHPQVTPLMPVPVQITMCWLPDDAWIICNGIRPDGSEWDRSLVLRTSDVDAMARRLGSTAPVAAPY